MPDSIKLSSMTLDCPDRREAGSVLRRDHRGEVIFLNEAWATVDGPGGRIDFQTPRLCAADLAGRPRRCRSIWTSTVDNLATAEARVLAAGATKFNFQPNEDQCCVFGDPAGHPFCRSTWDDVPS